jgi:hypothetical protein
MQTIASFACTFALEPDDFMMYRSGTDLTAQFILCRVSNFPRTSWGDFTVVCDAMAVSHRWSYRWSISTSWVSRMNGTDAEYSGVLVGYLPFRLSPQ